MVSFLLEILALAAAVFLVAELLPGIRVKSFGIALIVALVFAILNTIVGGLLVLLTLPLVFLTLGLFKFVINAFLFWVTSRIIDGFDIDGVVPALIGAFLIAVVDWLINLFLP